MMSISEKAQRESETTRFASAPGDDSPRIECVIKLSERDFQAVLEAHNNPPEPTGAMTKAWRRYRAGLASGRIVVRENSDSLAD